MSNTFSFFHKLISLFAISLLMLSCSGSSDKNYAYTETIEVSAAQFTQGKYMSAPRDSDTLLVFKLKDRDLVPFVQSAVKQTSKVATMGPNSNVPYFDLQFALPVPPIYTERAPREADKQRFEMGEMAGVASGVYFHNHSAGMEVLPNGDLLAVYFSTPVGASEKDTCTTFVQSRLRFGSLEWDMPEPFFITKGYNDQSALLWNDNGTVRFFGGGRYISDYVPFRMASSTDNGQNWVFSIPQLDTVATNYAAQPITSAFRDPSGNMYFASDGDGSTSFLWRSEDEGEHWHDMGGRTGGRHSTIVPLDDNGKLLSIGGKNSNVDGWMPMNISNDWGATWGKSYASPFPPVGGGQRPCVIRLQSGNLLTVGDSFMTRGASPRPEWEHGEDCYVAISTDNGANWHIKSIPIGLPQHGGRSVNTLGYVTIRQAANGMIHILTTYNFPNIHYEFNEAWIWSDEPTNWTPEAAYAEKEGQIETYTEFYTAKNGKATKNVKSIWSARICPDGRYLLNGKMEDYYPSGKLQHEVNYLNGRKDGIEKFYKEDGSLIWEWNRDLTTNIGVWTQYYPNGNKKVESRWSLLNQARDVDFRSLGYIAEGPARHWDENGNLTFEYVFKGGLVL